jgi:ABC-type lipoprotein export system ATPase subunit
MIFLPLSITLLGVLTSNLSRSEKYLGAPEPDLPQNLDGKLEYHSSTKSGEVGVLGSRVAVQFSDCRASWEVPGIGGATNDHAPHSDEAAVSSGANQGPSSSDQLGEERSEEVTAPFDPLGLFDDSSIDPVKVTTEPPTERTKRVESDAETAAERKAFELFVPSLTVQAGEVVAVVGQVGSGKTCLLQTILGGGPTVVMGYRAAALSSVGLIEQESLVISGTISDNIMMGRPLNKEALSWAIDAACMKSDLDILPHGLDTVVGERGTTLSGGQQQRLSVARALYGRPNLLVADDPLAAVDAVVGKKIFESILRYVKVQVRCS